MDGVIEGLCAEVVAIQGVQYQMNVVKHELNAEVAQLIQELMKNFL